MANDDLMRLAARCEKATGPNSALDREMGLAIGDPRVIRGGVPKSYTAELDAAMTLVPENHAVNIDNGPCHWICLGKQKPMGRVDVKYPKPDYDGEGDSWLTVSAIAATPALALCAAALRATAALRAKEPK